MIWSLRSNTETNAGLADIEAVFPSRVFSPEDFKKVKKSSELKVGAAERIANALVKVAGKAERSSYEELLSEYQNLQRSVSNCDFATGWLPTIF